MTKKLKSQMDIFQLCEHWGYTLYRMPGRLFAPEMEKIFLLRCLNRLSYDDNKRAVLRRHGLFISPMDTTKSAIVDIFLKEMAQAIAYSETTIEGRTDRKYPTTLLLQGGVTWESIRGGANEGRPAMPQIHDCDFMYASEFFSFFGHTLQQIMNKVDQFNPALQEADIEVNLTKMKSMGKRTIEKFLEVIEDTTIHFSEEQGVMKYKCCASFVGCTRPIDDPELEEKLRHSGFLSRLTVKEWRPDQAELKRYYDDQFGDEDRNALDMIAKFNEFAWKSEYHNINYPPRHMVAKVVTHLNRKYWEISQNTGVKFEEVRPGRDVQKIAQDFTVIALERQLRAQYNANFDKGKIDGLSYQPGDIDSVIAGKSYDLEVLEKNVASRIKNDPVLDESLVDLNEYVAKLAQGASEPNDYEVFASGDLAAFMSAKRKFSRRNAYTRVNRLQELGMLNEARRSGRTVFLRVTMAIIKNMGLQSSDEAIEEYQQAMKAAGVFDIEDL